MEKPQNNQPSRDPIQRIENLVQKINDTAGHRTQSILKRYPVVFSLIVTFALASIFYGFELAIAKIDFIRNNPLLLILFGLTLLIITGTTYKITEKNREKDLE